MFLLRDTKGTGQYLAWQPRHFERRSNIAALEVDRFVTNSEYYKGLNTRS